MVSFDPYLNWLGIPPHEQPPNCYRLLGLVLFESNPEVIRQAADLQSLRVGGFQAGPQGELCQQLLSEIAIAQFCLLDTQQKAAYDAQLAESLARRGERAVAAPPPPASTGGRQPFHPPPQPRTPMPRASAPAALPMAMPFLAPQAMPAPQAAVGPVAPPAIPPAAPPRPIDELESLSLQPSTRRHKPRKKKADYTTAIILVSVAAAAVLLLVGYIAVTSQGDARHGYDAIEPEKPADDVWKKLAEERKLKEKQIQKEKQKQRDESKPAAAGNGNAAALRADRKPAARTTNGPAADDSSSIVAPHQFGLPSRAMDAPDPGGHARPAPQPNGHDTPRDAGGENDPVMDPPEK